MVTSDREGEAVEEIPARSDRGLTILRDALIRGETILEFDRQEDGSIVIIPLTEHVQELEELVANDS